MRSAPRILDPEATRKSILRAATAVFSQKGLAAASLNEIADKAEVTKSLVLYHYGSKEDLWQAVLTDKKAKFFAVAQKFLAEENAHVLELVRTKFDLYAQDPDFPRLIAWMSLDAGDLPSEAPEKVQLVRKKIEAHAAEFGVPDGVDPVMFIIVLMSAVDGYFRFKNLYSKLVGLPLNDQDSQDLFFQTLTQVAFPTTT